MKPELSILVRLQGIDLEIRKLKKEKERLPERYDALNETIEQKEGEIEELKDKLADLRTRKTEVEDELELELERLKKSQQKLSAVKTGREFQALSKEIEEIKKANKAREDEILQLEEDIETVKKEVESRKKEIEGYEKEAAAEKKHINAKEKEYDKKIASLTKERDEVAKEVKPDLLARYNFLSDKRDGVVVAVVDQGVCSACNMNIPPQMFNELLREERILFCPSCQRIIYALKTKI